MKPLVTKETRNVPTTVEVYAEIATGTILSIGDKLKMVYSEGDEYGLLDIGIEKLSEDDVKEMLKGFRHASIIQVLTPSEAIERLAKLWGVEIPKRAAKFAIGQRVKMIYPFASGVIKNTQWLTNAEAVRPTYLVEWDNSILEPGWWREELLSLEPTKTEPASPVAPPIRNLGNLSATPPERTIQLRCMKCRVEWTGCQDAAACPECGDTSDYEAKTTNNFAPPIRRFKLVNAEWLPKAIKLVGTDKDDYRAKVEKIEYFIENNKLYFMSPTKHESDTHTLSDFLALVSRGIYVEMTPGRVVYRMENIFWTTDTAGDTRWLCEQHDDGKLHLSSGLESHFVTDKRYTKIIG